MNNEIIQKLEHERIAPLLFHYAIPAIIGTMVNALYNIVDRIFIGQGVGPMAISGLTLTFPILLFLQAFGMLVGAGAATRISIHLGRKAHETAEHVLGNALTLTLIINLATILPCMIFMEELLLRFGGSEQTLPYAMDYLYIVIPGNFFANLAFNFNAVMRASGYPKKAMVTMMLGAILNVILDAVFIFGFNMGIRGAAIATALSMLACAIFVMSHFVDRQSVIRFHPCYFRLKGRIVWNILTIGISPFSMQMAGSLVVVIMNHSLKRYGGDLAIGASGIITSVVMLIVMLIIGLAQGSQPIVGFNYGARRYDRVEETLKLAIGIASAITTLGWIISLLFPSAIVSAFTSDPELERITDRGLVLTMVAFFGVGSQIIISQFFQSIGLAWKAMFLSLSRQIIFLIPGIYLLGNFWGLDGVWLSQPVSDFIAAVTAWIFLAHHKKSMRAKVSD